MLKAIETRYKGYRFRSRLEARWAVFFDALGIRWEYEPEGFDLGTAGLYLPDFWLPQQQMWLEIKGKDPSKEEIEKAEHLGRGVNKEAGVLIVFGSVGDERFMLFDPNKNQWLDADFIGSYPVWCDLLGHGAAHLNDANYCDPVRHAYEAARSARFEHGESPNA